MSERVVPLAAAPEGKDRWLPSAVLAVGVYAVVDVLGQTLVVPALPGSIGEAGWSVLAQTVLFNSGLLLLGLLAIGVGLSWHAQAPAMRRAATIFFFSSAVVVAVVLLFILTSDAGVFLGARPAEGTGDPSTRPFWRGVARGILTAAALLGLGILARSRGTDKGEVEV